MRQYRRNVASHGLCITSYETDTGKAPERPTKFRRRHDGKRTPWNNLSRGGGRSLGKPVSNRRGFPDNAAFTANFIENSRFRAIYAHKYRSQNSGLYRKFPT